MTDNFFKNGNREVNAAKNKQKYGTSTPEHERLQVPVIGDPRTRDLSHGVKPNQMTPEYMRSMVTGQMPVSPLPQGQHVPPAQHQVREQPVTYSANPAYADRRPVAQVPQQKPQQVPVSHPMHHAIKDIRAVSEFYHTQGSDDLDVPPEVNPEAPQEEFQALSQITEGYYVLFHNDEIVQIGTSDVIEEAIEELVGENKVNFNDLVVMKRVSIKTGVSLREN